MKDLATQLAELKSELLSSNNVFFMDKCPSDASFEGCKLKFTGTHNGNVGFLNLIEDEMDYLPASIECVISVN